MSWTCIAYGDAVWSSRSWLDQLLGRPAPPPSEGDIPPWLAAAFRYAADGGLAGSEEGAWVLAYASVYEQVEGQDG